MGAQRKRLLVGSKEYCSSSFAGTIGDVADWDGPEEFREVCNVKRCRCFRPTAYDLQFRPNSVGNALVLLSKTGKNSSLFLVRPHELLERLPGCSWNFPR